MASITQVAGSTTTTATTYAYDAVGNETDQHTTTVDGAGGSVNTDTRSTYDSHNRLSEVTEINGATGAGILRTAYNYDAVGNRRAVFAQNASGGTPISIATGGPGGSGIPAQTAQPSQGWSFNVAGYFTDHAGFGLTYTATGLPGWLQMNSAGALSGTPTTAGSWSVTVTATDVLGQHVSETFTVTVPNVAPKFTAGTTNRVGTAGYAFSFTSPGPRMPTGMRCTTPR